MPDADRTEKHLRAAANRLAAHLQKSGIPGYGVGFGSGLVVLVNDAVEAALVPKEFEGIPVEVCITGGISALGAGEDSGPVG